MIFKFLNIDKHKCPHRSILLSFVIITLVACSTEKNTAVNRSFHYVNARFNGHFNANELLDISLTTYRNNVEEDYYNILPLEAMPSELEIEVYYPMIDTAISKIKTVITDHSMPSNDRPAYKNAEHNNYIDENWITIGKAYYYRRDYETAMRSFKFVNKYFSNDPSNYIGELWMAKTNIRVGNYTDAKLQLDQLDQAIKNQEESKDANNSKSRSAKGKSSRSKSKKTSYSFKQNEPAKFPNKIKFDIYRTRADLALSHKDYVKTIEHLENALKEKSRSEDKGRTNFILGQLYERQGNYGMAVAKYRKARKYKIPFQMSFSAQLKSAILEGGDKTKKKLNKMLRDAKNAEYRDQIYYALAQMEIAQRNEDVAMDHLSQSAFYSTTNIRQKGMAYEKMGDISYNKRQYIQAQKYYDSCVASVNEQYPNLTAISIKAQKLADLVVAVETAIYEDSIQRIAKMDEKEQETYLKQIIKQQEEDKKTQERRDAEKMAELAKSNNAFNQTMNQKGTGYWSNSSLILDGVKEFKKTWGQRTNEDHWRRSQKTNVIQTNEEHFDTDTENDAEAIASISEEEKKMLEMKEKLPKTDEEFQQSNQRLMKAYYDAGIIYKEMLSEIDLSTEQFLNAMNRNIESDYKLMSAYQLYKIYEQSDRTKARTYKDYILNNYPNSDYANYLRDPDYFIKKRERDKVSEQEYVEVLQRYNRKIYYPVILKAQGVMDNEPDNRYRAKYMLLLAMSMGQTTENKKELLPILEQIISEYPNSEEEERAKDMIDIIKNGYSINEPAIFGNNTIYEYQENVPQIVIVFLEPSDNIDLSKTRISDFTREFFPKSKLKISTSLFKGTINTIRIENFPTEKEAKEYVKIFKNTKKHLLNLREAKIRIITPNNLKILYESTNLEQYELFYQEYY